MVLKDFLVAPLFLMLIYLLAFMIRPMVTDAVTKKYFMPALSIKFFGAIALGLIYQFYYGGGDTFGYTTFGSSHIWDAFSDNPIVGLKLIFLDNEYRPDTLSYALKMWYFDDDPTYFVVRVAGFLGLLTFDTYSATALFFATFSFSGLWAMFTSFYRKFPALHFQFALALFFVPSVVFWGSGVMKDTLTLGALGWVVYALFNIVLLKRKRAISYILFFLFSYIIFNIKIYILLCFLPAVLLWLFFSNIEKIPSELLRIVLFPIILSLAVGISLIGIVQLGKSNPKYSIENILLTAEVTAKDNSMWTVRKEGSGYNLGDYDFSPEGLLKKFAPAVIVTLYRPYLWEVSSPIMLLSALESLALLILSLFLVIKNGLFNSIRLIVRNPLLVFCITFTVSFAFSVGITSGNFGSLVRYKIPTIPFFLIALFIMGHLTQLQRRKTVMLKNVLDEKV